jgi:hypothetical protein
MFSDPIRIADAINNPRFHAGDEVVLAEGPHKYVRGTFLRLRDDVEWAEIQEPNGTISKHPVEWMRNYPEEKSPALDGNENPWLQPA